MKNLFILMAIVGLSASCAQKLSPEEQAVIQLKQEIQQDLTENILPFWAAHAPDSSGGFYGELHFDGTPEANAPKGGILNARLLWTFSSAYRILQDETYRTLADRAQRYFLDYFLDREYGGSYYVLNADGSPLVTQKNTYQNAFAIYGLSEHYRATGNEESLQAAIGIYNKLVEHAYDPVNKGFIEGCSREWEKNNQFAAKTMNTNLHVLEAFTNLYRVWKDPGMQQQLKDEIDVMRYKIIDSATWHEILYLSMDWQPSPMRIDSYGHDVEYSWLLVEAAEVLGDEEILADTKRIAVNVAGVQIEEGLTPEGYMRGEKFHGERPVIPGIPQETRHRLEWWPQAEAVLGFINAWQISHDKKFLDAAILAWEWTKKYMIDHEYGEWYGNVYEDGTPKKDFVKADQWRCPYHNSRMGFELLTRFPD
ncbi:MAG: AGE family epimerase/isomerase [Prevotellaceae bacterium]|jgi:mannobiose 2-epimerase|nr:AGE family epimerase/isomerase [Prevotellaceae bacterium]